MIRDFTREELEPVASGRDTELNLGGGTLLVLACGLVLLCVVCFGLGYTVGHRAAPDEDALKILPAVPPSRVTPTASGTKPGAGQAQVQPPTQTAADVSDNSTDAAGNPTPAQAVPAVAGGSTGSTQAQVKPAVDNQNRPALMAQPDGAEQTAAFHVQPPLAQVQGWMVQIAAVSHSEDAEVLVNALRRRGYTATARRDSNDSLIHVQTGPFVNRNDANAVRQKLLSDGYNAIVQ